MATKRIEAVMPNLPDYPKGYGDFWTIHNKRYDMSPFVDSHPAGRYTILQGKGRNCTELFESYHSLSTRDLHAILAKHYVEDTPVGAPDYDATYEWDPDSEGGKFWKAVKERVGDYFREKGLSHKATTAQVFFLASVCMVILSMLPSYFRGEWWTLLPLGLLYWCSGCIGMHDGGHYSIHKIQWVNYLFSVFGSALCSPWWWRLAHNVGHHEHTNVKGKDGTLFLLSSYIVAPKTRRRFLFFIPLFQTLFLCFFSQIQYHFLTPRNENKELKTDSIGDKLFHYTSRIAFFYMFIIYPFRMFPFVKAFLFAFVPYAINGSCFYIFSQVSHLNDFCFREHEMLEVDPKVTSEGNGMLSRKEKHWAVHQVSHTLDWGSPSPVTTFLTTGLCYQTIHHLFPQINSCHYPHIQHIVVQTCKEFGVEYLWVPTLDEALELHLDQLKRYNQDSVLGWWMEHRGPVYHLLKYACLGSIISDNVPSQSVMTKRTMNKQQGTS